MNNLTIHKTKTILKEIQCGTCGVWHAIPEIMFNGCYREGGFWICPNGHSRGYSEGSDAARLKKANKLNTQLIADLKASQKETRTQKTANTKLKKRIKSGVCPCCHRTFKQLVAHMKNKHPSYVEEKAA